MFYSAVNRRRPVSEGGEAVHQLRGRLGRQEESQQVEGETRNLVFSRDQAGLGIPQVLPEERVRVRGCSRGIAEV